MYCRLSVAHSHLFLNIFLRYLRVLEFVQYMYSTCKPNCKGSCLQTLGYTMDKITTRPNTSHTMRLFSHKATSLIVIQTRVSHSGHPLCEPGHPVCPGSGWCFFAGQVLGSDTCVTAERPQNVPSHCQVCGG